MAAREVPATGSRTGGVQSIQRAFSLLETIADNGGALGLSQLATESGLPLPTIHRLVRTLVDLGYLRQDASRRYVLAPKLAHLGEISSRMFATWARPHLERLVDELGESANVAMLDGDQMVYLAQVPSRHSMRMFTEVGRRVLPHCTAVGKAVMASMPADDVRAIVERSGMPRYTENTVDNPDDFLQQLQGIARQGYAIDEGEQEVGVRCVAVAVPRVTPRLAISISGPATRMNRDMIERAVPLLASAASAYSSDLR